MFFKTFLEFLCCLGCLRIFQKEHRVTRSLKKEFSRILFRDKSRSTIKNENKVNEKGKWTPQNFSRETTWSLHDFPEIFCFAANYILDVESHVPHASVHHPHPKLPSLSASDDPIIRRGGRFSYLHRCNVRWKEELEGGRKGGGCKVQDRSLGKTVQHATAVRL